MRKLLYLSFLNIGLLLICFSAFAQTRPITGTVTSSDGKPLMGVTVSVKGTKNSTTTNENGHYTINAKTGDVLQFTSVGQTLKDVTVGPGNEISIQMTARENVLGEVVVTAMDIKRNKRELGYSAQTVGGNEIASTQRENFLNGLQGRVAGVSITPTSGAAGASTQIVLRGFNSMTLSNQPLFIVDGIILDNSSLNETSNGGTSLGLASDRANRTNDYTNRIADLNPTDIESVTILKGPEATALYGSQASAGAVVITTKKAVPGRTRVEYSDNFRAQLVTRYADENNNYTIGNNGVQSTLPGSAINYFGPAYPAGTQKYDNIKNFFRTGFTQTHNIIADFGTKKSGFRLSTSYLDDKGVIPNNDYRKVNVRLSNTTKINKYISVSPAFQYINSVNNKPIRGAGGYLLDLYAWPSNMDVRNYQDANGYKNRILATDFNSEVDNPLFSVYNNHGQDKIDRYIGTLGIDLTPTNWLLVSGRFGYDYYNQNGYQIYHPMSNYYTAPTGGYLDDYYTKYYGYNHTITATAHKNFGKFGVRVMVGTMYQDYETKMWAVSGSHLVDSVGATTKQMWLNGKVVSPDQYNQLVANPYDSNLTRPGATRLYLSRHLQGLPNEVITRQLANFGSLQFAFNNYLFLEYTHRFESSSLFPAAFRSYNYPGLSLSAILSDIFPKIKGNSLEYAKLRFSLAGTARQQLPYMNQSVFVVNLQSSNLPVIYSYGYTNNNEFLQPERQRTWSLGTELRFFQDRLNFDVSYYNTYAYNQIASQFRASYATGFILNTQNAAALRNEGVEIVSGIDILRKQNLTWNMQLNFTHQWSKVLTLPNSIGYEMYLSDTWLYGSTRVGFIRGMPATTITSYHYSRNTRGDILISPSTGLPLVDGVNTPAGDRNPDFTLGAQNNIRYKSWSLSFLWDLRVGGDIFNGTEEYLTYIGRSRKTDDRMQPRVIQGVLADGLQNTDHPTPNNIVIIPYYQNSYYTSMPEEEFIQHNINWFRLRDVTLTYNLPSGTIQRFKSIKQASVFVTGNDLLLFTNYRGADPAVNGTTAGEPGVGAYGFDFGVLPTTTGLSFGLRVQF